MTPGNAKSSRAGRWLILVLMGMVATPPAAVVGTLASNGLGNQYYQLKGDPLGEVVAFGLVFGSLIIAPTSLLVLPLAASVAPRLRYLGISALATLSLILTEWLIVKKLQMQMPTPDFLALNAGAAVAALVLSFPVHAIMLSARAEETP